jgi:hypothetical protein
MKALPKTRVAPSHKTNAHEDTSSGECPTTWTQEIMVGFSDIPKREFMSATL